MRNGFKLTLMVAIALMGMQVSAMVPTVRNMPDPIIGDSDGASGTNEFVYPDALDLDAYGTDADGPSPLVWTYEGVDDTYTFNDAENLNGGDPVSPTTAQSIKDNDDPGAVDTDAATVTIRNANLSPIGGPNTDPGAAGIVDSETRVITLYASDGATVGMTEITVYTDNEGADRLSTSEEEVASGTFASGPEGWTYTTEFEIGGTVSSSSNTGALCITVSDAGVNGGYWYSPYDLIELTNESVYIGRFNLTTGQTQVGQVPLILIHIENSSANGAEAVSLYFNDFYFLDNEGGANAPEPIGEQMHMVLFTPPPVSTAEWQSGAFTTALDPVNDARVRFRLLDVDGAGYGAETDDGQVCMLDYQITKVDISAFSRGTMVFDDQDLTAADWQASGLVGTTATFSGGNVTLAPTDGNWEVEVATLVPGDGVGDITTGTGIEDEYPIPWTTDDQLYELVIGLSAPSTTAENQPVDLMRMGMDVPTQEYIGLTEITPSQDSIGMPNTGAAQTYRGFYAPNNASLSSVANYVRLRPRIDFISNSGLGFNGNAGDANPGGVTIHGMTVYEVSY